ncbi:chromatin assembly factor 1 subunit FAS1-like [Aristolochia californica]|uniref:chromatin assembly factor 1 subunit FAS1-like n=1 Tax=Aristolochia californica TaxID=171875 RepID=UPI0035DBA79E
MVDRLNADGSLVVGSNQSDMDPKSLEKLAKKPSKRKRMSMDELIGTEDREALLSDYRLEIENLYAYYREILSQKISLEAGVGLSANSCNAVVAYLLEESSLPFSNLVEEIYEKTKTTEGTTLASVRSSVLFVGQRSMYGVANADADVLEDNSESCLWCWETRDLKLLPKAHRGVLSIRRNCRKKIQDRIAALSTMVSLLSNSNAHPGNKLDLTKAYEKLGKTLNEKQIRAFVENLLQKNGAELAAKEAKLKEKEMIKELERNKREVEKEKKRADRDLLKEKLHSEKERKRLQDEAEKEERQREKEEAELKKQLQRQQEEAEKEQRRREKEGAELKKQLAIQKQATLMERLFKRKASNEVGSKKKASNEDSLDQRLLTNSKLVPSGISDDTHNAVTSSMDAALFRTNDTDSSELLKSHMAMWIKLSQSICCSKSQHWGIRCKPKRPLIKELKLQGTSSKAEPSKTLTTPLKGTSPEKLVDVWEETVGYDDISSRIINVDSSAATIPLCNRRRKLLQFDKSHRPAYYGTISRKSDVVGPRCPFKKDPNLDYDVDSDEEWEEEEPGESLSDCEKDAGEETLEEGDSKDEDADGSEDSFMVPDGYLSEDEGVQVDRMEIDSADNAIGSSPSCFKEDAKIEEFKSLLRSAKYLSGITDHALRKNQPLIITNLKHEKSALITAEDISGTTKLEQVCLQALSIRPCFEGAYIGIQVDHSDKVITDQEASLSQCKIIAATPATGTVLSDNYLPKIVSTIQSCPSGINKVVETLQRKFPDAPKNQLRNKVREIAEFVDHRWQVKKEILNKLGLSASPVKGDFKRKGIIASFFSKRCMPASGQTVNLSDSPPCRKPKTEKTHVDDPNSPP